MNITKPGTPPYCHPTHTTAWLQPSFLAFPGHNNIADSLSSPLQHNLITGSVPNLSLICGLSVHTQAPLLLHRPLADLFRVEISFSLLVNLGVRFCSGFFGAFALALLSYGHDTQEQRTGWERKEGRKHHQPINQGKGNFYHQIIYIHAKRRGVFFIVFNYSLLSTSYCPPMFEYES
jgi:hypothetical protein